MTVENRVGIAGYIEEPLTWHQEVYGQLPPSEHLANAMTVFEKLEATHMAIGEIIDGGDVLDPTIAQDYAERVARLHLGMREFCRNAGVDPERALLAIQIGRREKYVNIWEEAKAAVTERGDEPTTANIRAECRGRWGKWQFEVTDEEYVALVDGSELYRGGIAEGMTPEEARVFVRDALVEGGTQIERRYMTQTGDERTFDLTRYLDIEPGLPGLVASTRRDETRMGQDMQELGEARVQTDAEIAEVRALHDLFQVVRPEQLSDPIKIRVGFDDIEAFRAYVETHRAGGTMSPEEAERYVSLSSLEELETYIRGHMAYELLDVVVAASGIVHRAGADVDKAVADATAAREEYAKVVLAIQRKAGLPMVHPRLAREVVGVVRGDKKLSALPRDVSVTVALAALGLPAQKGSTL